jgi:hypothetical protein
MTGAPAKVSRQVGVSDAALGRARLAPELDEPKVSRGQVSGWHARSPLLKVERTTNYF